MANSETNSGNADTAQRRTVDRAVELKNLQEELIQLRREMERRFEQQQATLEKQWSDVKEELAMKEDRDPERKPLKPSRRQIVITTLFLVITGACLIVYLFNFLVYLQPDRRGDALTILSTLLAMIGGLYLAYDLLGREGGPLAWLTAYTTNALIGMLIFTPLMAFAPLSGSNSLHVAPILFVGGMVSGFASIFLPRERSVQNVKKSPFFFSPKTWAIEIVVSFLFWLLLLFGLGIVGIVIDPALASVPFLDAIWFMVSSPAHPAPTPAQLQLMLGQLVLIVILTSVLMHGLRHFMMSKPPSNPSKLFHWRAFLGAFAVWFLLWFAFVSFVAVDQQGTGLWIAAVIAIGPALVGAMSAGIARFALQWANSLAERRLGLFGLCIATAGALLACVLPLLDLLK